MKITPIEHQYCEQPTLLLAPKLTIAEPEVFTKSTPFENIINSALSVNPGSEIWVLLIGIMVVIFLLSLPNKGVSRFLIGVPMLAITLLLFILFSTERLTPYAVHSAVKNDLHREAIVTMNGLSWIFERIGRIKKLPKLSATAITKKKIQLRQFSSYILIHGIKRNIATGRIKAAVKLADTNIIGSASSIDNLFRSVSHWEASRIALYDNDAGLTLKHAEAAYHYNKNEKTESLIQTALAAQAMALVISSNYQYSLTLLQRLRVDWEPQKQQKIIEYIARHQFIKDLENNDEFTRDTIDDLLGNYKILMQRFGKLALQSHSSPVLSCDTAGLLNVSGSLAYHAGDIEIAIAEFLIAEELLKGGPYTKHMLIDAYTADGHAKYAAGKNNESLSSFTSAYKRQSSKEHGCNVSLALNAVAVDLGNQHEYLKAFQSLLSADIYCQGMKQTKFTRAALHLSQGEYAMSNGQFKEAAFHFKEASKHKRIKDIALKHHHSIQNLKNAYKKLNSIIGIGTMPKIDGVLCSTGEHFCENILLIKGGESIGLADDSLNELYFTDNREPDSYVIVTDADNDGYHEQWNYASKHRQYIYFDLDKDYRADWLKQFSEDNLVDERPLSGKVSIQFSAAINAAADVFSEPDTFLVVKKNDNLVGRSQTVNNNTYPNFRDNFVIHYKYQDQVSVAVYDRDIFFHDLIDSVVLKDLPETGYIISKRNRVALAMKVVPSEQPEGTYSLPGEQGNINPFQAPSWLNESSEVAQIVKNSRKEQSRAKFMAMVGSVITPEIVLGMVTRPVTFFNAFVIGIGSHMVTYELLTHRQP